MIVKVVALEKVIIVRVDSNAPAFVDMAGVACDDPRPRMQARARRSRSVPPWPLRVTRGNDESLNFANRSAC
jgi:hypothetical protein